MREAGGRHEGRTATETTRTGGMMKRFAVIGAALAAAVAVADVALATIPNAA